MTIAELHGKLAPKRTGGFYERMEDLLTSDVFGTMKYAGWEAGFLNWLRSATAPMENFRTASLILPKDEEISFAEYRFWPTLKSGREPDLLIAIHQKSSKLALIIIEAKYLSGPSNIEMDGEFTVAGLTGDQIADQINDFPDTLNESSRSAISARIHIYLTAHHSCPMETFQDSNKNIRRKDVSYFWLNWQALTSFLDSELPRLDEKPKLLVQDLIDLLKRKDLVPFRGFRISAFDFPVECPGCGFWKEKWWMARAIPHGYEMTGFWGKT
jgi:hypothetical protein